MRSALVLLLVAILFGVSCDDKSLAISAETQQAIDLEKIDKYLADNGIVAQQHPSGLRFVVNNPGSGDRPGPDKCVRVNYKVWFLGETDIVEEGTNLTTPLANTGIVLAWRIGLKEVQKGGSITLYVPSSLAYGPRGTKIGTTTIPQNQCLIFDVDVVNITGYNSAAGYCYAWPQ